MCSLREVKTLTDCSEIVSTCYGKEILQYVSLGSDIRMKSDGYQASAILSDVVAAQTERICNSKRFLQNAVLEHNLKYLP